MEYGCNKGNPGLLRPTSFEYGYKSVQHEHGEEVASGGDDDARNSVVLNRAILGVGDHYSGINASSRQVSRRLTSSQDTQELGERRAESPLLLEDQATLGSLDKVQCIPSK